jgi:hypothetical protein
MMIMLYIVLIEKQTSYTFGEGTYSKARDVTKFQGCTEREQERARAPLGNPEGVRLGIAKRGPAWRRRCGVCQALKRVCSCITSLHSPQSAQRACRACVRRSASSLHTRMQSSGKSGKCLFIIMYVYYWRRCLRTPHATTGAGDPDSGVWREFDYHRVLGTYCSLFVDDILCYSRTLENHVRHLRQVCVCVRGLLLVTLPNTPSPRAGTGRGSAQSTKIRALPRILQNMKSCGLSVARCHESPSPTAAGAAGAPAANPPSPTHAA